AIEEISFLNQWIAHALQYSPLLIKVINFKGNVMHSLTIRFEMLRPRTWTAQIWLNELTLNERSVNKGVSAFSFGWLSSKLYLGNSRITGHDNTRSFHA